jgi:hypothetical protein
MSLCSGNEGYVRPPVQLTRIDVTHVRVQDDLRTMGHLAAWCLRHAMMRASLESRAT